MAFNTDAVKKFTMLASVTLPSLLLLLFMHKIKMTSRYIESEIKFL